MSEFDRELLHPNYRPTKTIVDRLIHDKNYRYADERYFDHRLTWLEVLRITFAHYLANKTKRPKNEEQIGQYIDHQGIQTWLDWVNEVQTGRGISKYGHHIDDCSNYQESPGIKPWQSFYCSIDKGAIMNGRNHSIWFDKHRGIFVKDQPEITENILEKYRDKAEAVLQDYPLKDISLTIGEYKRKTLRVIYQHKNGSRIAQYYDPFSLRDNTSEERYTPIILSNLAHWDDLQKEVEKDFVSGGWPEENPFKMHFNVQVTEQLTPGDLKYQITPVFEIEEIDHQLKSHATERMVSGIHHPVSEGPWAIKSYTTVNFAGQTLQQRVMELGRIEASKLKRRRAKARKLGANIIEIDAVASHLLDIVSKKQPQKREEILSGKTISVLLKVEDYEGFVSGRGKKNESVSFSLNEGILRARIHIGKNVLWQKNRMMVSGVPESTRIALVGKKAREVFDHPIADLLGHVRDVYPISKGSDRIWISFELHRNKLKIPV